GFLAAGIAGGIKAGGKKDMALIHSPTPTRSAAVFTSNQVKGAPVQVSMEHARSGALQAIIASSGCSNVCTGERGVKDAREMAKTVADSLHVPTAHVLIAATGVIGVPLPMDRIRTALPKLVKALSPQGGHAAAEAIMTTDTRPKEAALRVEVNGRAVTLGGIAKGVGMIEPHLATMFCFVASDAAVARGVLNGVIRRAVDRSFNRVTVDSDTSTSDTVAILANGLAENRPVEAGGRGQSQFTAGLEALSIKLAKMLVTVRGAASRRDALVAARSVANSPLLKCAFNGADPNWGRIMMALGKSAARIDQDKVGIAFGDEPLVEHGALREGVRVERIREIMG